MNFVWKVILVAYQKRTNWNFPFRFWESFGIEKAGNFESWALPSLKVLNLKDNDFFAFPAKGTCIISMCTYTCNSSSNLSHNTWWVIDSGSGMAMEHSILPWHSVHELQFFEVSYLMVIRVDVHECRFGKIFSSGSIGFER